MSQENDIQRDKIIDNTYLKPIQLSISTVYFIYQRFFLIIISI